MNRLFIGTLCVLLGISAKESYRLSNNLDIIHYDIFLSDFDLNSNNFTGIVKIDLNLRNGTIQIHTDKSIKINEETLEFKDTPCKIQKFNETTQIVTLDCEKSSGKGTLYIEYNATIVDTEMSGLYKSTYEGNGTLIATQFEPTNARKAFPCFDEPSLKATFQITVGLLKGSQYKPLSNTPLAETLDDGDFTSYVFTRTPRMSTYLVALVISKFSSKSPTDSGKYDFQVYARPEALKYTKTAVTYGRKLIDAMGEYTGYPYETLGIAKLDQVGIPDFAAGAMENWGLLTYRETALLDEGDRTSVLAKQKVITVTAHEIAHQWFGDYVTMNWWSETWLNEGFATYFEYHIANLIGENMELDKQFLLQFVQYAMIYDSTPSVQAMFTDESKVNTLAEINDKFTDISYSKGGSVLRMIRFTIGEDAFKKSLNSYLTSRKHKNTNHTQFLNHLGDTKDHWLSWIEQPGFPLITVSLKNKTGKIEISQSRFTTIPSKDDEKLIWDIPITYTTSLKAQFEVKPNEVQWLTKKSDTFNFDLKNDTWVIVNLQESGYYRVNYDEVLWNRIIAALKKNPEVINELNRAQIIDDIFNLARNGFVSYNKAFEMIDYLVKETSYYPLNAASEVIGYLITKVGNEGVIKGIKSRMLTLLKPHIEIPTDVAPNRKNLTHVQVIKEILLLQLACIYGDNKCLDYSQKYFKAYIKDRKSVDTNFRKNALCHGIRYSTESSDWNSLWSMYGSAETSHEKESILSALGCTKSARVLEKFLIKSIMPNSGIRKQDASSVFQSVLGDGSVGLSVAMKFLENNMNDIKKYYKDMSALGDMITSVAYKITTKANVDRLAKIINDNIKVDEIKVVSKQALEIANANVKWTNEHLGQLLEIFPSTTDASNKILVSWNLLIISVIVLVFKF
ncbi:unnamed protein product [Brassicogethes aeneus]|uniref:Aminopeptidase n=1 Tax=Brassicogethes aeneus TaxID=1431903 RepID=A0A9P0B3G6_BRAAE|nr:unnamed protein product [Brassicogethes aeneus]